MGLMTGGCRKKHSFKNDYSELAHPKVIEALGAVGAKQFDSYGLDEYSQRAAGLMREKIGRASADVHFVGGGTHANLLVLSSMLRPFEAVIAPCSGHIFTNETGAIEATGHKVISAAVDEGKIGPDEVEAICHRHKNEHMVKPRVLYISQSTENGTVYTKTQLSALSDKCRSLGLYLYIDGARLAPAVNSPACDLSYADIAGMADAFYMGGTKNGAMFGEAVVICSDALKECFRYNIKQRGAMLAKGAAIGAQFEALLTDGLCDKLASHANRVARIMADGAREAGYGFMYPVETNQIFPILPRKAADRLHESYDFNEWGQVGDDVAVRLVASWATPPEAAQELARDLLRI